MSELKIDLGLDQERIGQLIHAAILSEIGPEQRDKILAQALEWLTKRPDDQRYGARQSPLELAFNSAVQSVANDVVREIVKEDQAVRGRLKVLMGEAISKLMEQPFDGLAQTLRGALADALVPKE